MTVRRATLDDLPYIEALRRKESECIGFIPKQRYEMEIQGERSGAVLVCVENGELVGFTYATFGGQSAKIQQIAIQEDARRMERATELVNAVNDIGKSRNLQQISCRCAEDLESNRFWGALGFLLVGQTDSKSMYGRGLEKCSRRGRKLNMYIKSHNGLYLRGEFGLRRKYDSYPITAKNTISL